MNPSTGAGVESVDTHRRTFRSWLRALSPRLLFLGTQRPSSRIATGLLLLATIFLLVFLFKLTATPVTLIVDGHSQSLGTHQTTVEGLLREANIVLGPEDLINPPLHTRLTPGSTVVIQHARHVAISVDGQLLEIDTQQWQLSQILIQAGVMVKPTDEVLIDGHPQDIGTYLPDTDPDAINRDQRDYQRAATPPPVHITVRRAVPVALMDGSVPVTFYTTHTTIGEALLAEGIQVFLGDRVSPSLGSRVVPGIRVYIERSTPVTIHADGLALSTRTQRATVGELLAQEGIPITGKDYSLPPPDTPISQDLDLQVIRVKEAVEVETQLIPFESEWVADPNMPIDTQEIRQAGESGMTKRRFRLTYENGHEISNVLEDEWFDHPASTKTIAYGTQIAIRTLETPEGPVEYWRHFRALATAYSAATSGKAKDHPYYGITSTGMQAGYGIIAVDPKVIPLRTQVYVDGYGKAVAGDTGGAVLGRHVDLGYDEDVPPPKYAWVDVYLLTPIPPADKIRYVLPNWPQQH